jgi:hypothetical protein
MGIKYFFQKKSQKHLPRHTLLALTHETALLEDQPLPIYTSLLF